MRFHRAFVLLSLLSPIFVTSFACSSSSDDTGSSVVGADDAGSQPDSSIDGSGGSGGSSGGSQSDAKVDGPAPTGSSVPSLAKCGGNIFDQSGQLQTAEYEKQARLWTKDAIDCRLGARYSDVHDASEADNRPGLWAPTTTQCGGNGTISQHEYGSGCSTDCSAGKDFGSTEGPVIYEPDSPDSDPGVDRVTNYGYDGTLVSVCPQASTGGSHPDPSLSNSYWPTIGVADKHPFAVARTRLGWGNNAIAIFKDGFIGALGTRTDGVPSSNVWGYRFPANLAPTSLAITAMNEFLLVTLWDTTAHQGKLAVFALQGNSPMAHTWWYIGLPNAGGFWAGKLLGYVDLPVATPTSVAVVTNGIRTSPHDTGEQALASYGLVDKTGCHADTMKFFAHGGPYTNVVASHGYALIASRWENKVVFVDLKPLITYFRKAHLEDFDYCSANLPQVYNWDATLTPTWFDGDDRFPYPFSTAKGAEATPVVAGVLNVNSPRDVAAGFTKYGGIAKAYALSDDGTVHMFAPNRLYRRQCDNPNDSKPAESDADPAEIGTIKACSHATSILMNRWGASISPSLLGGAADAGALNINGNNDLPMIVCRGDRKIQQFVATGDTTTQTALVWELADKAMGDPVAIDQSERGPVMTVADFDGKKLIGYQMGDIVGQGCSSNNYTVHAGSVSGDLKVNRGGSLSLPGSPHGYTSTNVN